MPAVSVMRARDLPEAPAIGAFRGALTGVGRDDQRLLHAPEGEVAQVPEGMTRGRTLFGPGHSPAMTASPVGMGRLREVTSVLLHDAAFVSNSMTVLDRAGRVFGDGIDNLPDLATLAGMGAPWSLDADGALCLPAEWRAAAPRVDVVALPVCGVGLWNYGHFLCDGLPLVLLHARVFADADWRVIGPAPKAWQAEILRALGLAARYLVVDRPTVFSRVLTSTLLSMHVSYPTQFLRPVFDLLRFGAGGPVPHGPRRIFLSRAGHDTTRRLRNRAAVEAAMALQGYAVVQPDRLSVTEQIRLMAGARFVVGESGAGLANLGFCPPGTVVLEIQSESFVDSWIRGLCFHCGHRWRLYVAAVDDPPKPHGPAPRPFTYQIDPIDLMSAVARIEAEA